MVKSHVPAHGVQGALTSSLRRWIALLFATILVPASGEMGASPLVNTQPLVTPAADGLTLEWHTPPAQFVRHTDGAIWVEMPGYLELNRPGLLRLPFDSVLIALPPDSAPTAHMLLAEEQDQARPASIALAPIPDGAVRDPSGQPVGGAFTPARNAVPLSGEPIELEVLGSLRGVRLARLSFYPVRLTQDRLRVISHLRVSIRFNSVHPAPEIEHPPAATDLLLGSIRSAVINPDQVQPSTANLQPPTSDLQSPASSPANAGGTQVAIEVNASGLTAISYEALSAIGFPVSSVDPRNLHLTRAEKEIALEWDGDDDSVFEPGERLLFYAAPRFSRYSSTDVYFLSSDSTPGMRMVSRSAAPAGLPPGHAWIDQLNEINALYTPDCLCPPLPPGRDGDRWTWDDVRRPDRASPSYSFRLPAVDATTPASLTLWLIGYTDIPTIKPDHRVDVQINDVPLGYVEWHGKQAITSTFTITPGILTNDLNTFTLNLPGLPDVPVEGMWLDAFSIHYARSQRPVEARVHFETDPPSPAGPPPLLPHQLYLPMIASSTSALSAGHAHTIALAGPGPYRAYDVTHADRPVRLADEAITGNTISLGSPLTGMPHDYLVTSASGIQSPAQLRLTTRLGTVTGADYVIIAPADLIPALSDLITLRRSQGLGIAVENVLAIYDNYGDGRVDPTAIRAYLDHAYRNWNPRPADVLLVGDGTSDPKRYRSTTPPTLIPPYLENVDPYMGETAADNRYVALDGVDNLPDIAIGRLPVNSITETQIVINKIVQYETQPLPGGWNGTATFVADNPDSAGNFAAESDLIANTYITPPFTAQRIYFSGDAATVASTHQAILNQWNAGAGLIMYTGHSSILQWAAERLFHTDDMPALDNGTKLPVVLEMTCFTGSFQNPAFDTLDESLLRKQNGGAVAVWGAAGLGVSTGHSILADGFMRSVYHDGRATLGAATLAGKLELFATGQNLDLIDTFVLLGDPAMRLNLRTHIAYLPSIRH